MFDRLDPSYQNSKAGIWWVRKDSAFYWLLSFVSKNNEKASILGLFTKQNIFFVKKRLKSMRQTYFSKMSQECFIVFNFGLFNKCLIISNWVIWRKKRARPPLWIFQQTLCSGKLWNDFKKFIHLTMIFQQMQEICIQIFLKNKYSNN